jgi:hypothetical protein
MKRVCRAIGGLAVTLGFWGLLGVWAVLARQTSSGTTVVGIKGVKTFHLPGCPLLKRVAADNKVDFASREAAEMERYSPCVICKPSPRTAGAASTAVPPPPPSSPPQTISRKAVGEQKAEPAEGIVFSREIAPVLASNCLGCHEGAQAKKQFDMSTFQKLMKGSSSGPMIVPRQPEESELLLRVKGESSGRKMPPGNTNLAEPTIARIESWIKAGALLDAGIDPTADLRGYAPTSEQLRRAEVARLSPEERETLAESQGRGRIAKATSSLEVTKRSSPHFVLLSALPEKRGEALLKGLEVQVGQLKALLGPPAAARLEGPVKIGVYVFPDSSTYAEFVRGVESRELEAGAAAHANLAVETPYLVAVDPLAGLDDPSLGKAAPSGRSRAKVEEPTGPDRSLLGLLAESLAVGTASQAGKPPRWLSLGLGAYFASRIDPRSRYVASQRISAYQQYQLNWGAKVGDALRGETDAESIRAIGFSMIEWLVNTQRPQFAGFVQFLIQEGPAKLDDGIRTGWGVNQDDFVRTWGTWVRSTYSRVRA